MVCFESVSRMLAADRAPLQQASVANKGVYEHNLQNKGRTIEPIAVKGKLKYTYICIFHMYEKMSFILAKSIALALLCIVMNKINVIFFGNN